MKVQKLNVNKRENRISFLIENTTPEFANLLRRAIIDRVPVLAFDEIEFRENDSVLYDEIIAHRLAMISLKTDLKSYEPIKDCKCEG
ncbi:MAG: DNA-directed RNA polymerase subunit D, partial [Nanoarchaeota archaeon]|nr:DNA-directed RNA polymerase subunit D [Nanoarchaeota archaeon]